MINRTYPSPGSVKGAVLADLLTGSSITHCDCWLSHGSSRLAHHILMLKRAGWTVETDEDHVSTSDGRRVTIARYKLSRSAIQGASEEGRQFIETVRRLRATRG